MQVIYSSLPPSLRFSPFSHPISITDFCTGVYPGSSPGICFEGLAYMAWRLAPVPSVLWWIFMSAPGGLFLKRQLMQNTFQRGSVFLLSDDPSTKQTWEGGGSHTADPVSVYETEAAPSHASPLEPSRGPPPTRGKQQRWFQKRKWQLPISLWSRHPH